MFELEELSFNELKDISGGDKFSRDFGYLIGSIGAAIDAFWIELGNNADNVSHGV